MWHLDTNTVIAYLNGNRAIAEELKDRLPDVAISSLVLAELLCGANAAARVTENIERARQFLQVAEVASFDQAGAEKYSQIRFSLRKKGRPTAEMDLLIAAVAMANDATLVTHNVRHFQNIDGLSLEDWMARESPREIH